MIYEKKVSFFLIENCTHYLILMKSLEIFLLFQSLS